MSKKKILLIWFLAAHSITLTVNPPANKTGITQYRLQKYAAGAWKYLTTIYVASNPKLTYVDTNVAGCQVYQYRARSYAPTGYSTQFSTWTLTKKLTVPCP